MDHSTRHRQIARLDLTLHFLHLTVPLACVLYAPWLLLRVLGAAVFFLGAFTLSHDAIHGALGLPRRSNGLLLSVAGCLIGISGHAARRQHLLHHQSPLSATDHESAGGERVAWRALFRGLSAYPTLPFTTPAHAHRRERWLELYEWSAVLATAALCVWVGPRMQWLLAITLLSQLSLPFWGGYLPHHPPPGLLAVARRLAWTRLPLFTSLFAHDLHHRRPKLPSYTLGVLALEQTRQHESERRLESRVSSPSGLGAMRRSIVQ